MGRTSGEVAFFFFLLNDEPLCCCLNTIWITKASLLTTAYICRVYRLINYTLTTASPAAWLWSNSVEPFPSLVLSVCPRLKVVLKWGISLWLDSVEWCIAAASGQDTSHSHSDHPPINASAWSKNTEAHWAAEGMAGLLRSSSNFHQVEENTSSPLLLYLHLLSLVNSVFLICGTCCYTENACWKPDNIQISYHIQFLVVS